MSKAKPPICKAHSANLETIIRAAKHGQLALVECRNKATGEIEAVLSAIGFDGSEYVITPFAALVNGNPYEVWDPPNPEGGFEP